MKPFSLFATLGLITGCLLQGVSPSAAQSHPATQGDSAKPITVTMEAVKSAARAPANNQPRILISSNPIPVSRMARHGQIDVEKQKYALYLPASPSYSTQNRSGDNENNASSLLFVDENGDGLLTSEESRFANMPLRIGDHMFVVESIASDGSAITLRPSAMPLRGLLTGRACPPFSYKTLSGDPISLASLKGKAFLIDIWSYT